MTLLLDLSLPWQHPVAIMALVLVVILVAPLVFRRYRVPGLIGLIVAGIVIGPNALGLLDRDPTIVLLGTVGLLYLMFLAGLEIDLALFSKNRNQSIVFGALTFLFPQGLGTLMAYHLLGFGWPAAILLGSVFASHTLLAYPIASRLGLAKTPYATTAVGATIITDVAALLVLAIVAASTRGALDAAFWVRLSLSLAVFWAVVFWGIPRLGRWFFRTVRGEGDAEFIFVLAVVFVAALGAELAGVEAIIGAFLAGLALNRLVPEHGPLMARIRFVGESLFIPFFLISVGMLVDFRVLLAGADAWIVAGAMLATVTLTKWAAAQTTRLLFGYGRDEGRFIFGLTIPQAAATLAAVLIGFEVGLFGTAVLNGTIVMILATCTIGPWVTEASGRRLALRQEVVPPAPGDTPQRILVPLANPETAPALMNLAFFVRDPKAGEPIYPLTVAQDGVEAAAGVAASERLLSYAVVHAAAADVPVVPVTRVDESVTAGIVRAVKERRVSTVIIGWNGQPSAQQWIFGGVLDGVLEGTEETVVVCRLDHPLNTTGRVVLAVPPFAEREAGFGEAAEAVRRLAGQVGARLLLLAEAAHLPALERFFRSGDASLPFQAEPLRAWRALPDHLDGVVRENDLLVLFSAREGALSWQPALDRLPRALSPRYPAANFLTVYPAEAGRSEVRLRRGAGGAFEPDAVVVGLPGPTLAEALEALLHSGPPLAPDAAERLRGTLGTYPIEIRPGVVLLHGTAEAGDRPVLLAGTSAPGLRSDYAAHPVHVVLVLLSPAAASRTEHLRALARLAHVVRSDEAVARLRHAEEPAEVVRVFAETGNAA